MATWFLLWNVHFWILHLNACSEYVNSAWASREIFFFSFMTGLGEREHCREGFECHSSALLLFLSVLQDYSKYHKRKPEVPRTEEQIILSYSQHVRVQSLKLWTQKTLAPYMLILLVNVTTSWVTCEVFPWLDHFKLKK